MDERYYTKFAVAAVRGKLNREGKAELLGEALTKKPLEELGREECEAIINMAKENGVQVYHFKKTDKELPRVHKVLGFLKGIYFESLLDVGSGRGVFLLPFMDEFPYTEVKSVDILDKRIEMLSDMKLGGVDRLSVTKADICEQPFEDDCFDVVTMLEVLEHIPNVEKAIKAAVNMAKKYVVVTVPSKEDNNPEHIHLLTKEKLTKYFSSCGVERLSFDAVPGHLFMIAKVGEKNGL